MEWYSVVNGGSALPASGPLRLSARTSADPATKFYFYSQLVSHMNQKAAAAMFPFITDAHLPRLLLSLIHICGRPKVERLEVVESSLSLLSSRL